VALPNYLDNPDGSVYQRSAASTADDAYFADRWYALTQTGAITPSQQSNPEDGYRYALRILQAQASSQRMGAAQIVPGARTSELRGKTVAVGGRFKSSAGGELRCAILAWTGSEDAVTSDVVNDWTNTTYTTGNFFASTSLSLVATDSETLTAGTAGTVSASGTVPSGATNLIYLFWLEAAQAQNATLDAWGQRLVQASTLVDYIKRDYTDELRRCHRFLPSMHLDNMLFNGLTNATTQAYFTIPFQVEARVEPTGISLVGTFTCREASSGTTAAATLTMNSASQSSAMVLATTSGLSTSLGVSLIGTAGSKIIFTGAEL
jgi:hypothetical protein